MPEAPKTRNASLDLFKTFLVYGMILAHVIQLISDKKLMPPAASVISNFADLVTFSGFMLAFGLGVGLSGLGRQKGLIEQVRPVAVMLAAVYISSLAFDELVRHEPLSLRMIANLLSMRVLSGYSEFLASFFVLYVLIVLARPAMVKIASTPWMLLLAIVFCMSMTAVTTSVKFPLLGTIISSTSFANFPLAVYLAWFLVGISIGVNGGKPTVWHVVSAVAASGAFIWFVATTGKYPARFPPGILWLGGPAVFLLGYLALARFVSERVTVPPVLLLPGRHVLTFLLLSNLVIFATYHELGTPFVHLWSAVAAALSIMLAISLWCGALEAISLKERTQPDAVGATPGAG